MFLEKGRIAKKRKEKEEKIAEGKKIKRGEKKEEEKSLSKNERKIPRKGKFFLNSPNHKK